MIQSAHAHLAAGGGSFLRIVHVGQRLKLAGLFSLSLGDPGVSICFRLSRACWGPGLGSEAVSTVVDWLLALDGVWRVWSYCDARNTASARTLTRGSLAFECLLRGSAIHPSISSKPRDCQVLAAVRG